MHIWICQEKTKAGSRDYRPFIVMEYLDTESGDYPGHNSGYYDAHFYSEAAIGRHC